MFKIFNLWRQKAARRQETPEGYLPYFDNDDSWPLRWHEIISKSPSGQSCISTITDFLEGFGFSDTNLENEVVNSRGEKMWQIHQKCASSFSEFEGFYILTLFEASGRVAEIFTLPFECCRLGKPDSSGYISKIYYNPFFGTKEYAGRDKKETIIYDVWNPQNVRAQIAKQGNEFKGQVMFVGTTTPLSRFYPMHEAVSATKWMKSEAGVADYYDSHVNNGFLQPYILVMKGNPNDPSTNPDMPEGTTVAQEFDMLVGENFMGANRVGNAMVQWVNTGAGEEMPEVISLPTNANSDTFITLDNQATKKITVAFKVPGILANINEGVGLGGDGNTMRVAVKLMQHRVVKKQRILTDTYQQILSIFNKPYTEPISIVPYNPYPEMEVIDQKIWDAMSEESRKQWIQENTEIELIEDNVVETPDSPAPPTTNKFVNVIPVPFPDHIRENVKKALEMEENRGMKCSKPAGRRVSNDIMNNSTMSLKQIKRIHSYLKNRSELENGSFDNCEVIQYNQWGGKAMETFLDSKLKEVDSWLN